MKSPGWFVRIVCQFIHDYNWSLGALCDKYFFSVPQNIVWSSFCCLREEILEIHERFLPCSPEMISIWATIVLNYTNAEVQNMGINGPQHRLCIVYRGTNLTVVAQKDRKTSCSNIGLLELCLFSQMLTSPPFKL